MTHPLANLPVTAHKIMPRPTPSMDKACRSNLRKRLKRLRVTAEKYGHHQHSKDSTDFSAEIPDIAKCADMHLPPVIVLRDGPREDRTSYILVRRRWELSPQPNGGFRIVAFYWENCVRRGYYGVWTYDPASEKTCRVELQG